MGGKTKTEIWQLTIRVADPAAHYFRKDKVMRYYRGQQIDNKKWIQGYLFQIWEKAYILWGTTNDIPNMTEVIPETVGQYAGRKDKNDKKIYGNDVCTAEYCCLVCFSSEPHELVGTIEQASNGLWMFEFGHGGIPLDSEDLDELEIVGTIHENPDLLEREFNYEGKGDGT